MIRVYLVLRFSFVEAQYTIKLLRSSRILQVVVSILGRFRDSLNNPRESARIYIFSSPNSTHGWITHLYPKGNNERDKSFSLFLSWVTPESSSPDELHGKVILRAKDQLSGRHVDGTYTTWFRKNIIWGFPEFVTLGVLNDLQRGILLNDTLVIEVEVSILESVSHKPIIPTMCFPSSDVNE